MDPARPQEVIQALIVEGVEGPWQEYSSGFNAYWATAGIFKRQTFSDGRIVLEILQYRDRPDLVIRVYQETPPEIFFARLGQSSEGIREALRQARVVFESLEGREAEDDFQGAGEIEIEMPEEVKESPELREKWGQLIDGMAELQRNGLREALNPIPPPFRFEDFAEQQR